MANKAMSQEEESVHFQQAIAETTEVNLNPIFRIDLQIKYHIKIVCILRCKHLCNLSMFFINMYLHSRTNHNNNRLQVNTGLDKILVADF